MKSTKALINNKKRKMKIGGWVLLSLFICANNLVKFAF